jgi:hypothetical protein
MQSPSRAISVPFYYMWSSERTIVHNITVMLMSDCMTIKDYPILGERPDYRHGFLGDVEPGTVLVGIVRMRGKPCSRDPLIC